MSTEPARLIATITGGVAALIALLVAFGIDLTEDQKTAILGAVAVAAPIVAGFVIRSQVVSPNTAYEVAVQSANTHVPDPNNRLA